MVPVLNAGPDINGSAVPSMSLRSTVAIASDSPGPFPAIAHAPAAAPHANGAVPAAAADGHDSAGTQSAANKVSELEAEMNRLLGQLSADRRSS
jgi:hypothetical protein